MTADPRPDIPPLNRFILDLVATQFGGAAPAAPDRMDWDQFIKGVIYHRVPLLIPLTGPAGDALFPEPVLRRLRAAQKQAALQSLALDAAVIRAAAACRTAGVEVLLLKGPAHSELFFGGGKRRWSRDIDLLTRPADLPRALAALAELGYAPGPDDDGEGGGPAITLRRPGDRFPVELHTDLDIDERLLPLDLLQPFADAREIRIGDHAVLTMSPEKSVVYAAFHGAKHLWRQYFWLCDIAAAQYGGRVCWSAAFDIARRVGVERHLAVACLLTGRCFALPSPSAGPEAEPLFRQSRPLANALRPVLADGHFDNNGMAFRRLGRMGYLWWDLRLQRRWPARWATLAAPWRPGPRDRLLVRLPRWLAFLYPLVRLWRVLADRDGGSA